MLIYNVTTQVPASIQDAWLEWMKTEHIPEVLISGHFTHHRLVLLREPQEPGFSTFAVQYFCNGQDQYNHYIEQQAPHLRKKALDKWGDSVISFRSLMEVIN